MPLHAPTSIPIPRPAIDQKKNVLPVPHVTQKPQDSWCWAACLEMVLKYHKIPASTKGDMANLLFQRSDCSGDAPGAGCDYTCKDTDIPLLLEQMGLQCEYKTRPITFSTVKAEIDADRPMIAAHAHFNEDGIQVLGHMVVITGWEQRGETLLVHGIDPIHGPGRYKFFSFLTPNGRGVWVRTYMDIKPQAT